MNMKKTLIIISVITVILAVICIILTNKKTVNTPNIPVKKEQIKQNKSDTIQKETESEEPELLDENDMPKSDVKVPEIG